MTIAVSNNATYHLQVYGIAWGGFKAVYQYPAGSARAMILKGLEKPTCLDAGDFQEILDWRLVEETIDTFKTLRGFRNGMNPGRFNRLLKGIET